MLLILPAAWLSSAAGLQALGAGRPLDALVEAIFQLHLHVLALRAIWLGAFNLFPLIGLLLALVALVGGDLGVADWRIDLRLRLPRPPWRAVEVATATVLGMAALVVAVVAAHAVAG